MKVITLIDELREIRSKWKASVGFVPTMGALHAGHAQLLHEARKKTELTVLSIFVNPTQFNDPKDLEKYPRTLEKDLELAKQSGTDIVWTPDSECLYPDKYRYKISESSFSKQLCGEQRSGHFDGVLTVVLKLLNIVQPTHAFFGEKDYQQLQLVKGMADAFFLPLQVIGVPTVREKSGLAMSSRNTRLTSEELSLAPEFYRTLVGCPTSESAAKRLTDLGFKVDYIQDLNGRRFGAAYLGQIRLIDNVQLHSEREQNV